MIYLAADIHGHLRLPELSSNLDGVEISEKDHLIILGDAGIIWDGAFNSKVMDFYSGLVCQTLFIDGNHENFTLLNRYPVMNMFGGSVHCISDKILHLCRGELYVIDGKRIFAFGGGFSLKRLTNTSPISVWEEEMPNEAEYANGLSNLKKHDHSVDFILTHEAPTHIVNSMGITVHDEEIVLTDYLQKISYDTSFKKWYFGHFHKDWSEGKYRCLYDSIIRLGE